VSDSLKLYRTIAEMMLTSRVRFHDKRCMLAFIWAVVCMILEKNVNLSKAFSKVFVRCLANGGWKDAPSDRQWVVEMFNERDEFAEFGSFTGDGQ